MILYAAYFRVIDKEREAAVLQEHLDYVNRVLAEGIIYAKGLFTDKTGGPNLLRPVRGRGPGLCAGVPCH